ncbi:single-stranded DNA-binding protein [Nocardia australiensis]|uniref:single-stranded DNA-binding protein n=1 Tax=Nocardia australiensis TaxID=2887191 RepID=UPI001D158B98|nr:single-stranded DNA-binding protein [Nocardia australiensis]
MYESMATVVGNVVTHPVKRDLTNGEQLITFRMASNSRRFDAATGEWVDNGTLYLTISCWRRLVAGVDASIRRGDPIMVHGQLRSHEYRTKDGVERRDLEMRAASIGPDLARCSAPVIRRSEPGRSSGPNTAVRSACDRPNTPGAPDAAPGGDRAAATAATVPPRAAETADA